MNLKKYFKIKYNNIIRNNEIGCISDKFYHNTQIYSKNNV